jgi:hypothetical protein
MEDRLTYTYYFSFKRIARARKGQPPHIRIPDKAEVEVSEYWYAVLKELDRQEYNNSHAETRRHIVFDEKPPKQLCEETNPLFMITGEEYTKAKAEVYYTLYDKILRGTGILTPKQQAAFTYRVLCQMPFKDVAFSMRFECQMNESENSAKKHFYNAARKIRKHFQKEYDELKIFLRNC